MQPLRPIERLTRPLNKFLHIEAASGIVLIACTLIALAAANSEWSEAYLNFWNRTFSIGLGHAMLSYPLWYWVNDGLMTIFFFLVGLEIKRELVAGELRDKRRVIAPAAGAVGGAVVPALIFLWFQAGEPTAVGWAIPMATDIAFVVGVLTLLGKRVPHGLKVFLLTLAIIDDILAVLVIALFYSGSLKLVYLAMAAGGFVLVGIMGRTGVRSIFGYFLAGSLIWLATLKSGIHPTVSGVLLGLITPSLPLFSRSQLGTKLKASASELESIEEDRSGRVRKLTEELDFVTREAFSPLERLEVAVHPWAAFAIMPIFALANAGVPFSFEQATTSLSVAVLCGLVLGKPLGIMAALGLVTATGLAGRPGGTSWGALVGASCLAGIGFTMSLFVASLSLADAALAQAKSGILLGSAVSVGLGLTILAVTLSKPVRES